MCFEYEWEYQLKRAEEARRELLKSEEQRKKPKPPAPAAEPEKQKIQETEAVPT